MNAEDIEKILEDENKITMVSRKMFDDADTDKSGIIELPELKKLIEKLAKDFKLEPPTDEQAKEVLKELDTNKTKKIEFEEFKVFVVDILASMLKSIKGTQ